MANEWAAIVGTSLSVVSVAAVASAWILRAAIAKEVTPKLVELSTNALLLAQSFAGYRESKEAERVETRAILTDLNKIVQDHETRLTMLEAPPPAVAAMRSRRRSA